MKVQQHYFTGAWKESPLHVIQPEIMSNIQDDNNHNPNSKVRLPHVYHVLKSSRPP